MLRPKYLASLFLTWKDCLFNALINCKSMYKVQFASIICKFWPLLLHKFRGTWPLYYLCKILQKPQSILPVQDCTKATINKVCTPLLRSMVFEYVAHCVGTFYPLHLLIHLQKVSSSINNFKIQWTVRMMWGHRGFSCIGAVYC